MTTFKLVGYLDWLVTDKFPINSWATLKPVFYRTAQYIFKLVWIIFKIITGNVKCF